MAGLGTLATTSIITKGISGQPACKGIITTHFSLYYYRIIIKVIPPEGSAAMYSTPLEPGQIHNLFKPVEHPYFMPVDRVNQLGNENTVVTVLFKINNTEVEKYYSLPKNAAKPIVQILNLINKTKERINITISKFRNITNRGKVLIKNLRLSLGKNPWNQ